MKLIYWRTWVSNFGDGFNPWIWERLLPNLLDEDDRVILVGFGTLLNDIMLPPALRTIVFGAGVGYGQRPAQPDPSWDFYCVRGPMSARVLGLPRRAAVTDGAMLVRRLLKPKARRTDAIGFMPHWMNACRRWQAPCEEQGIRYIDPRNDVDACLDAIRNCNLLVTESLHGAIVADAMRVPWIPVLDQTNPSRLPFKWLDWTASVRVRFRPSRVNWKFRPDDRKRGFSTRAGLCEWPDTRKLVGSLRDLSLRGRPHLSSDTVLGGVVDELSERLHHLKRQARSGTLL